MSMKKVVFYVVTGETDKAKMALTVARRAAEFKRFEDVKVVLQGPSEKLIIDEDPAVKDNLDFLIKNKCIVVFFQASQECHQSYNSYNIIQFYGNWPR